MKQIVGAMWNQGRYRKKGIFNKCRIDGKIAEQQKKIKVLTKEIGNLTVVRLEAGDEMCPKCGAKTSVNMKYCGVCSASLKEVQQRWCKERSDYEKLLLSFILMFNIS